MTLLTVPKLSDQGGVASYYNGVLSHLSPAMITPFEIGGTNRAGGALYPFLDQIRFRMAVNRKRSGLVHINPSLNFKCLIREGLFAWQTKRLGLPLLVFWHGWEKSFEHILEKKYLWFFKRTYGYADGFIVLASEFERTLRKWGVVAPVYRETTCVDDSLLEGVHVNDKLEKLAHYNKEIKILFLARLEKAKGVFETVHAVKKLIDKKMLVSLTVAGDGNIRRELEEFTRKLGLSHEQVCFTGDIRGTEKVKVFASHHIYCFPTFYGEGLPTSVLEAMAFGMPVVTRPVGGLFDIFEDRKMGKLVHGKSPEEVAFCLEQMIMNKDSMVEIGRYNASYAKDNFMASKVACRLMNIYEQTIENHKKIKYTSEHV